MKIYLRPVFAILLMLLSTGATAQTLEAVTQLKLKY